MTTIPFRPGRDFAILRREMDRLFDDVSRGDRDAEAVWTPRADVSETDDAYVLSLDLPGIDRDTLDVTLDDGTLKISGERRRADEQSDGRFHRVERAYGRFFRSFTLGTDVDDDAIEATFDDGVLMVRVGKSPAVQPRRIPIGRRSRLAEHAGDGHVETPETVEAD
ncbi:Hsp20/alpha crystallin family protein [Rubrivirga sp. IMCC45206]|uniref:Hsp20/alpha crystallin family protein n=1 Tax=Rubrivirga sp. IMCC45206 TaxID=3391614 RepID=UPI00398F9902